MVDLSGKVALVSGASRGIGKGIVLGLAEAGATIYLTGRTVQDGEAASRMPGTIQQTAKAGEGLGGKCIPIYCDHTDDDQTKAVFVQIEKEQGRLDILVNNVWGGYEHFTDGSEFWKEEGFWTEPLSRWDKMFAAGVRAHYVCSALSVSLMLERGSGLIVNLSFWAAQQVGKGVAYSVAKAADDKMAECMAYELRTHGIAAVSLYPGLVRTESVMANAAFFDFSNSESPQFIGRAVAALAGDPKVMEKSGQVLVAARLALEYGFTDVDGKQPLPLTLESA